MFYCEICDKKILKTNKCKHLKTLSHLENLKTSTLTEENKKDFIYLFNTFIEDGETNVVKIVNEMKSILDDKSKLKIHKAKIIENKIEEIEPIKYEYAKINEINEIQPIIHECNKFVESRILNEYIPNKELIKKIFKKDRNEIIYDIETLFPKKLNTVLE